VGTSHFSKRDTASGKEETHRTGPDSIRLALRLTRKKPMIAAQPPDLQGRTFLNRKAATLYKRPPGNPTSRERFESKTGTIFSV
jgi:hypothetical protein